MKRLVNLVGCEDEETLFKFIASNFKEKITQWNYFVNWQKVVENIIPIEKELNLLNYLIGKENIEEEAYDLIKSYPQVIKAFPTLIAIREKSIDILVDTKKFIYQHYSFNKSRIEDKDAKDLATFIVKSGISDILKDKKVKNLVDYATGVEVGLDSNGRKNRGGTLMESLVEEFVVEVCDKLKLQYMPQATANKIGKTWGLDVKVDKSSELRVEN